MDYMEAIGRVVLTLTAVTLLLADLVIVAVLVNPEKYVEKTVVVESEK